MGESLKKILVFDSGVGGFSIVNEILQIDSGVSIDYLADTAFFPYGDKSDLDLIERIPKIVKKGIMASNADAVIIACNTASTIALYRIREIVDIPVIGVVPAIKPAAKLSKTKIIGLLATPRTIGSAYTDQLIEDYAQGVKVIRYGPPKLARAAEDYILGGQIDNEIIKDAIYGLLEQIDGDKIDKIILACTHYPLVRKYLAKYAPNIDFIDSGVAIAKRLIDLLKLENNKNVSVLSSAFSTGANDAKFFDAAKKWGFKDFKTI